MTPNWQSILASWWGPETDNAAIPLYLTGLASNVVLGTNPSYSVQDFFAFYPKFSGCTVTPAPTGTAALNSNQLTAVSDINNIAIGNPINDSAGFFADGTVIIGITSNTLTLSSYSTGAGTTTLTVFNAPLVPTVVVAAFIALASACLIQARWQEMWPFAMGLMIAHYVTLYLTTDGQGASTAAQAATQGISSGIRVSKSVGDVSVGYQAITGIEEFAAFNLTAYGQQLATLAAAIGSGPMLLY